MLVGVEGSDLRKGLMSRKIQCKLHHSSCSRTVSNSTTIKGVITAARTTDCQKNNAVVFKLFMKLAA